MGNGYDNHLKIKVDQDLCKFVHVYMPLMHVLFQEDTANYLKSRKK